MNEKQIDNTNDETIKTIEQDQTYFTNLQM